MLHRFQSYIEQQNLCESSAKVLVAVSGGADSVSLLDLFSKAGYQVAIAHCNFRLRGEESDAEEQFVRQLGKDYQTEVFVQQFDTRAYADKNKISIQEAARDLRYQWFEELRKEKNFDVIAVAHHADDQVETFFINLLRGSGLAGLKGMPVRRGYIIRPLLFAQKGEIEEYVSTHQLKYCVDSSNNEEKYLRNKIRHQLIPALQSVSDQFIKAMLGSMEKLQEDDVVFRRLLNEKRDDIINKDQNTVVIPFKVISKFQPTDIWCYYLLKDFGFNRPTTDQIVKAINQNKPGRTFYSETHRLLVDRNGIMIRKHAESPENEYLIEQGQQQITEPVCLSFKSTVVDADFRIEKDYTLAQLDQEKLIFPLQLRKWKEGDRFRPLGMSGSKLVSDYFTDNKISRFAKDDTWLVLSGNDIVWLVGYRISDDYKVTPETKQVFTISQLFERV